MLGFGMLLLFAAATIAAGASFVVQQAVNADLRVSLGSAAWAGFISYLGGTLCMLVLALAWRDPLPSSGEIGASHWWAWTGGIFGAAYIAVSILLVHRFGAAAFVALLVAGQMFASLAFDQFGLLGMPPNPLTVCRLLGAVLLVAAVVMIRA